MFSPDHKDTLEAMIPSGFTAINSKRLTPPGRYNLLPPEDLYSDASGHSSHRRSTIPPLDDDYLDDGGASQDAFPDHNQALDEDEFIKPSIEYDTDTTAAKVTSDSADLELTSSDENHSRYSYSIVKGEAREMFDGEQPEFCVKNSRSEKTRYALDAHSDTPVEMRFCQWEGQAYGY